MLSLNSNTSSAKWTFADTPKERHRGDNIATIQTEYRWNGLGKAGFVGFFGLATVWGDEDISGSNGEIFPGGGVGFRYTVFEEQHMNVGLDAAVGKNDWGLYFRISEAF